MEKRWSPKPLTQHPENRLILALDMDNLREAEAWVKRLHGHVGMFKVGLQLYTAAGPTVLDLIHSYQGQVFLDLKLHDIPHTVARAGEEATKAGVALFNVHALGGREMMRECAAACRRLAQGLGKPRPLILAVTLLTSLDTASLAEVGIGRSSTELVPHLAALAQEAGLDGVVAAAPEARAIRRSCGEAFIIIVPGVRLAQSASHDHRRTATPEEAIAAGADYLVVGRPITEAREPLSVIDQIVAEINHGLSRRTDPAL